MANEYEKWLQEEEEKVKGASELSHFEYTIEKRVYENKKAEKCINITKKRESLLFMLVLFGLALMSLAIGVFYMILGSRTLVEVAVQTDAFQISFVVCLFAVVIAAVVVVNKFCNHCKNYAIANSHMEPVHVTVDLKSNEAHVLQGEGIIAFPYTDVTSITHALAPDGGGGDWGLVMNPGNLAETPWEVWGTKEKLFVFPASQKGLMYALCYRTGRRATAYMS